MIIARDINIYRRARISLAAASGRQRCSSVQYRADDYIEMRILYTGLSFRA